MAYQVVAKLGAGGMGELYRARDPRPARDVAIKVLPAAFSSDVDRLGRFEQEGHIGPFSVELIGPLRNYRSVDLSRRQARF